MKRRSGPGPIVIGMLACATALLALLAEPPLASAANDVEAGINGPPGDPGTFPSGNGNNGGDGGGASASAVSGDNTNFATAAAARAATAAPAPMGWRSSVPRAAMAAAARAAARRPRRARPCPEATR